MARPILIADYDPRWPALFEQEKARILSAAGRWLTDLHHVGSTAVPGLAAKPVIDICAGLRSHRDGERCVAPLQALGYEYLGEAGIPRRYYFRKPTDSPLPGQTFGAERPVARTHQVHMYETDHPEFRAHLLFRDYLRVHPDTAREYEALKRELAGRCDDVEEYATAKTGFVRRVLRLARAERREPVRIVDYDPGWPAMFEEEKARILDAIGEWLADIQHVGSTSVPGLAAKPIIDIMPGLRDLADAAHCIDPLRRLGYEYMPEFEDELPERRYFNRGYPATRHVHMVATTSHFWRRHLLFREYLRAHPDAAAEYAALKRGLAAQYGRDHDGYTEAKTEFITAIEEKARAGGLGSKAL